MEFLNGFLTIVLVFVSLVLILVVLMQRGSANGGLGAAMGGGMAESAFGAETTNVLSKTTRNIAIVFFVMVFGLYLSRLWDHERSKEAAAGALPEIEAAQEGNDAVNALQELISQSEAAAEEADAGAEQAVDEAAAEEPAPTQE